MKVNLLLIGAMRAAAGIGAAVLSFPESAVAATLDSRPNVVFIVVDDLGISDLACYGRVWGNDYHESPNVDRLAEEGVRFLNAFAACPVCSPTRAAIMTGKYPARTGITDWIPGDEQPADRAVLCSRTKSHMDLSETTLAEAFKAGGYATSFVGKWHLGDEPYYPEKQGFDVNIAGCHWGHPKGPGHYCYPFGDEMPNLPAEPGDYLTDRLTDEAIKQIQAGKASNNPFLLYLAYYTVHGPLIPREDVFASFNGKEKSEHWTSRKYAAMVKTMDDNVGRVLKTLTDEGLEENTIVLFTSDNGGMIWQASYPYRAGKGTIYDGGVRGPLIVKWPGVTVSGSTCVEPVISMDFYPTLLEMAGLPLRPEQHMDGLSIVPLLQKTARSLNRDALYWHFPHFRNGVPKMPAGAVLSGDFKLIERYETGEIELYNTRKDIGETVNLAARMPEKVQELKQKLADWREKNGAELPEPNPAWLPNAVGPEMIANVQASSTENSTGNFPKNAVDQNPDSRWAARDGSFPQWLAVDLKEPQTLNGVRISFRNRTVIKYTVEVADRDGHWTSVVDQSANTDEVKVCKHFFDKKIAAGMRVTVLGAAKGWATITDLKLLDSGQ